MSRPRRPAAFTKVANWATRLSHAYGAAFDNPDLIVACVVGDGEAETGPLATGWHGNKFLNPARDGCVLPILHLNGYKIANPVLPGSHTGRGTAEVLRRAWVISPTLSKVTIPSCASAIGGVLDTVVAEIKADSGQMRGRRQAKRPAWPMIVLPHAEGLDMPAGNRWQEMRRLLAKPSSSDERHGAIPTTFGSSKGG